MRGSGVAEQLRHPCRAAYLPNCRSIMGLARMERAKPIVIQTLDVVGTFATARVSPFPHPVRCQHQHLPQSGWSKTAVHPARRIC